MKIIFIVAVLISFPAFGQGLKIDIGDAKVKKSAVAIMNVAGVSKIDKSKLINQIKSNLTFSTYFEFVRVPGMEKLTVINSIQAEQIRKQGVEFLIAPSAATQGDNTVVQFKVYLLKGLKLALDKAYRTRAADWNYVANKFSDDFMLSLTGKRSIFNTKIAITSDKVGNRWKEVYVMDWNGGRQKRISFHKASALSPNWSPGGSQLVYSAITIQPRTGVRSANLYIYDFRTRKRSLLSSRPGINSGGTFFPDGRSLVMTLTQGGIPDLFRISLRGKIIERLTKGPGRTMNVEPSISPDGRTMAFSSDRSGRPMLYTMSMKKKIPRRLTIAGRYNSAPSWAPDGKKIVFAGWSMGHFDIFTMNTNGTNLKRITEKRKANGKWSNNESPSFSPDGRFISFISNRSGKKDLYIIRADGTNLTKITRDRHNYYHAKWSPYLR